MGTWRVLREPTVPILLAASVVHVVRRNVFDLAVFAGTAVVIVIDSRRHAPVSGGNDADRRSRTWLVVAGMTVFASIAALAPPATLWARLVLMVGGLAALAAVLRPPRDVPSGRASADHLTGWPVWAVIGVAACLWELASFIAQQVWPADEAAHPAVSDLVGPLLLDWPGRAVFLLLWLGAGWWLLRHITGSQGAADGHHGAEARGLGRYRSLTADQAAPPGGVMRDGRSEAGR